MPVSEDVHPASVPDESWAGEPAGTESGAWPGNAGVWGNNEEAAQPGEAGAHEPQDGESGTGGHAAAEGIAEDEEIQSQPAEPAGEGDLEEEAPAAEERHAGKVRWFGSFLRKNSPKPGLRAEPGFETSQAPSAETIPFPRPAPELERPAPAEDDYRILDDARAAVRNVFASLGEQRPNIGTSVIQAPVTAQADAERDEAGELQSAGLGHSAGITWDTNAVYAGPEESEAAQGSASGWGNDAEAGDGFAHSSGRNGFESGEAWPQAASAAEERPEAISQQSWLKGWQPDVPDDPDDMDAQLRNAMRAHFPAQASAAQVPQPQYEGEPADGGEGPVAEALTSFWKRPAAPVSEPPEEPAAAQEEESGFGEAEGSFDERLYREIEQTQVHAKQSRRPEGKGGLALTAAWGLFLCVAGGLTAGLFAFRDVAADALPGLVPFYRALGMPVTVQPLIFEGVQYDWTVVDNKPVLHIKGAVYNRAHRNVLVPEFAISIKDDDPALDREIPAGLPADGPKIGPEERTDFEIELLSPSPSITAVELELRNVR